MTYCACVCAEGVEWRTDLKQPSESYFFASMEVKNTQMAKRTISRVDLGLCSVCR